MKPYYKVVLPISMFWIGVALGVIYANHHNKLALAHDHKGPTGFVNATNRFLAEFSSPEKSVHGVEGQLYKNLTDESVWIFEGGKWNKLGVKTLTQTNFIILNTTHGSPWLEINSNKFGFYARSKRQPFVSTTNGDWPHLIRFYDEQLENK